MWFHSPCEHDLRSGVPEGQSSRPAWPAHPRSQMAVRMWMRVRRRRTGSSSNWRRCAMRSIAVVIRDRCRCVVSRAIREHGIGKREGVPASHRDRVLPIRKRSRRWRDAVSTPYRRRSADAPFVAGLHALRVHSVSCRARPSRAHRCDRRAPAVAPGRGRWRRRGKEWFNAGSRSGGIARGPGRRRLRQTLRTWAARLHGPRPLTGSDRRREASQRAHPGASDAPPLRPMGPHRAGLPYPRTNAE